MSGVMNALEFRKAQTMKFKEALAADRQRIQAIIAERFCVQEQSFLLQKSSDLVLSGRLSIRSGSPSDSENKSPQTATRRKRHINYLGKNYPLDQEGLETLSTQDLHLVWNLIDFNKKKIIANPACLRSRKNVEWVDIFTKAAKVIVNILRQRKQVDFRSFSDRIENTLQQR